MECQCCYNHIGNLNICDNEHYICNICKELTNVDCIFCNPLNDNLENRIILNRRSRQTSFIEYCKMILFILLFVLYALYINKIIMFLLISIDGTKYPYEINWTSFTLYQIIFNICLTGLVIVCCKV